MKYLHPWKGLLQGSDEKIGPAWLRNVHKAHARDPGLSPSALQISPLYLLPSQKSR